MSSDKPCSQVRMSISPKSIVLLLFLVLLAGSTLYLSRAAYAEGETVSFGVEGYDPGSEWPITSAKALKVKTDSLDTTQGGYSIRITVAKGMKLSSYLWNTADPDKWITGEGVQGTQVPMDNSTNDYFNGGSVALDAEGNTVLVYNTSEGCSSMNLTDKILVQPDEAVTYGSDTISDAIKFELLNSAGEPVSASSSLSVKVAIAKDKLTNSSFTAKRLTPGAKNVLLYRMEYYRKDGSTNILSLPSGTVNITLGIPACVERVTQLVDVSAGGDGTTLSNWTADYENHTVTITGYQPQEGKRFVCSIYGDISDRSTTGTYYAALDSTKFEYTDTYNHGTVTYSYPDDFTNLSRYAVILDQSQDSMKIDAGADQTMGPIPEGYPSIFGKIRHFYTTNAQTEDQIMRWDFKPNTLDVVGVFFPIEQDSITVTSVKFNDNTVRSMNLVLEKQGSQAIRYVNVADLKEADSTIPDDAQYILSITANCKTFSEGFSSGSWYGKPVGYFNEDVVSTGQKTDIEFSLTVNGKDPQTMSVTYDLDREIACLNILNSAYGDAAMTSQKTSFKAGETIYMSTRVGVGGNYLTSTSEPRFYVVVPQWMSFDPSAVRAKRWVTTSSSSRPESTDDYFDNLQYRFSYVQNAAGEYFTCYEFSVPGSAVGNYLERVGHVPWSGAHNTSLCFEYALNIEETAETQTLALGDYIMAGKGDFITKQFKPVEGAISGSTHADIWDMNGNGNRSENTVIVASGDPKVTILDNMNITVSGYLTHQGSSDAVNPYDPGSDGSNEVNVVEFMPSDFADYHVIVANTLVSIGQTCSVNAYIPIPNGSLEGDVFTPTSTDPSHTWYQFDEYKWPMELRGLIGNVDLLTFDIVYYFDSVSIGENGLPAAASTKTNPSSLSQEELDRVVLVEIKSKDGVKIPNGRYEFTLPLKVGVDETQATAANMNLEKNIFRPRYHREGGIGAVWVNGNYVAARLAVSSIGGSVFNDMNGNGHWDEDEDGLKDVTVKLYASGSSLIATKQTDAEGKYSFTSEDNGGVQLPAGAYTIKVTNPDTSSYVFTKHVAPTQANYKVNSEAVMKDNHAYAELELTLPYDGVLSGYQEYQNAGLFVDKVGGGSDGNEPDGVPDVCEVRVNYEADKGSIKAGQKTFEYFYESDGSGGYKQTFDVNITAPPTVVPNTGCAIDHWENTKDTTTNSDGKFTFAGVDGGATITVKATCAEKYYSVEYHYNVPDEILASQVEVRDLPAQQTKKKDEALTLSSQTPRLEDRSTSPATRYTFLGWNTSRDGSGTMYQPGGAYTEDADVILYAQWSREALQPYDVRFKVEKKDSLDPEDTGDYEVHSSYVFYGRIGDPMDRDDSTRIDGFTYWFTEYDPYDCTVIEATSSNRSYLCYYYKRNSYKITFNTGGGTPIDPITGKFETDVVAPADPTREGYEFLGWDKEIPETMPAEDMTINARWQQVYTATFKDHDGTLLETFSGVEGSTIDVPAIPNREGYNSKGWDQDLPDDNLMPDHDMTFIAQYEPIVYSITYSLNGGSADNPKSYTIESADIVLESPTKAGLAFQGWTGTGLSEATMDVTIRSGSTGNRTYVANWPNARYTITWMDDDGKTVLDAQTLEYGTPMPDFAGTPNPPVKADTAEYSYTFKEWVPDATPIGTTVERDTTFTASYTAEKRSYTITFENEDGTELQSSAFAYGTTPTYTGDTPTKASTDEYEYSFNGWDPEVVAVTGEATYTATYSSSKRTYTVTWLDDDGKTLLDSKTVEYGSAMPPFEGAVNPPTKEATAEYSFEFKEWVPDSTPEETTVTRDVTYTASYTKAKNAYTVIFKDEDGTELQKSDVEYGELPVYSGETPTKDPDAQYTYTFNGWSPDVVAVTGEATYIATYKAAAKTCTVTWLDEDGTVLDAATLDYGSEMPSYGGSPNPPQKPATAEFKYVFDEWVPDATPVGETVTRDITFTAKYASIKNSHTIVFVNEDGTELQKSDVEYGELPVYSGQTPTKAPTDQYTYAFNGWEPAVGSVSGEATYTATFTPILRQYTVMWVDDDGTELDRAVVDYGSAMPSYGKTPNPPEKEASAEYSYKFNEWVPDAAPVGDTVTRDVTYTASYEASKRSYKITFKNEDGTELQSGEIAFGEVPTYLGPTPTRAADDQYTYVFKGWEPALSAVTGEATYVATFTREAKPEIAYTFTEGAGSSWYQQDGKGAYFRVTRSVDDSTTFERFTGIEVDGVAVAASNYTAESGSVKLALTSAYIDSLSEGTHKLRAIFDDGAAETTFTVVRKANTTPSSSVSRVAGATAKTADELDVAWLMMLFAASGLLTAFAVRCKVD